MKTALSAALFATFPMAALASAPQPVKPVPIGLYSGRWYEIARTPNLGERGCQAATSAFSGMAAGAFVVTDTCRRANGRPRVSTIKATLVPGSHNAKFRMSVFGGLAHPEFWILDTAPSGDWAIMATPGGHYVWLLSRRPTMATAERAAALARVKALGYPVDKLRLN